MAVSIPKIKGNQCYDSLLSLLPPLVNKMTALVEQSYPSNCYSLGSELKFGRVFLNPSNTCCTLSSFSWSENLDKSSTELTRIHNGPIFNWINPNNTTVVVQGMFIHSKSLSSQTVPSEHVGHSSVCCIATFSAGSFLLSIKILQYAKEIPYLTWTSILF